jgi:pSer/pThr/pTyr-binding forkhead associated (FHA) protein
MRVAKLVSVGAGERRVHRLDLPVMTLGRHSSCEVVVDDEAVSRRHARIERRRGRYWIADLGSMNGTYVDGRRVDEEELVEGVEIHVGKVTMKFVVTSIDREDPGGGGAPHPFPLPAADGGARANNRN